MLRIEWTMAKKIMYFMGHAKPSVWHGRNWNILVGLNYMEAEVQFKTKDMLNERKVSE